MVGCSYYILCNLNLILLLNNPCRSHQTRVLHPLWKIYPCFRFLCSAGGVLMRLEGLLMYPEPPLPPTLPGSDFVMFSGRLSTREKVRAWGSDCFLSWKQCAWHYSLQSAFSGHGLQYVEFWILVKWPVVCGKQRETLNVKHTILWKIFPRRDRSLFTSKIR